MNTATALHIMPTAEVVETKETALVTIEPTTALAVFTDREKADAILAKIKKIVAEFKGDVTTAKGRAEIASMAYKIARSKTYVEAERKKQEDAERARLADEARVKADNERRAADLAHRESVHRAILDALKDKGIPPTVAPMVVSLLSTGSIPFVTIEY